MAGVIGGFPLAQDFTMNPMTLTVAISFAVLSACDSSAQNPAKRPFGERGLAPRRLDQAPAGQPGRGILADRDPSQMVAGLLKALEKFVSIAALRMGGMCGPQVLRAGKFSLA
jgi:hypothetical protein